MNGHKTIDNQTVSYLTACLAQKQIVWKLEIKTGNIWERGKERSMCSQLWIWINEYDWLGYEDPISHPFFSIELKTSYSNCI